MIDSRFRALALCAVLLLLPSLPADAQLSLGSPVASVALHIFSGTDGANPNGPLLVGSDGAFYGVGYSGGAQSAGVLYRVTSAGVETVLHSFGGSGDGANPAGALAQTSDGTIYGTTIHGGANNDGTIYSISSTGAYSTLYSFTGAADGSEPYSGLTLGSGNILYGATYLAGSGSGTLFSCTTAGALTTMYAFSALGTGGVNTDGAMPYGAPVQGSDGAFYGATTVGGANGTGVLYRIASGGAFSVLHTFAALNASGVGAEGAHAYAPLVSASDGNLYGTSYSGGANGTGAVFRVSPSGAYTTLYSFTALNGSDNTDGANPSSGLIQATDGNLYGAAGYGGANGSGALFAISTAGVFTSVCSFDALASTNTATGAARPYGGIVQAPDGTFYLSGYYGGSAASGAVVSLVQYTFPAGLQLISVPFDYTGTALAGALTATTPVVADWVGSTNQYAETPTAPADTLHQGDAYWARFAAPVSLTAAATDLTAGQTSFSIPLTAGWNMVGDPFAAAVPISSLVVIDSQKQSHTWADAVSSGLILPTLYSYDPTANAYVPHTTDSLQPYSGYWLEAVKAVTLQAPRP